MPRQTPDRPAPSTARRHGRLHGRQEGASIRRLAIVLTVLAVASGGSLAAFRYGRIGAEREAAALAETLAAAEEARVAHEAVLWRSDRGLVDDETELAPAADGVLLIDGRRLRHVDSGGTVAWDRELDHGVVGVVAMPDRVAVTLRSGAVLVLTAAAGDTLWERHPLDAAARQPARPISRPVVVDGTVLVVEGRTVLRALDLETGDVRWERALATPSSDAVIAAASTAGRPAAFAVEEPADGRPHVLHAFDALTGDERWQVAGTARRTRAVAVEGGRVLWWEGSRLGAYDATDGAVAWELTPEGQTRWVTGEGLAVLWRLGSPARLVTAYGVEDGALRFSLAPGSQLRLGGGYVVALEEGDVWHYDLDGELLRRRTWYGLEAQDAVVTEDLLYLITRERLLAAAWTP